LSILARLVYLRRSKIPPKSSSPGKYYKQERGPKYHYAIVNAALADFHKAQCYFAIALQLASIITFAVDSGSVTLADQYFLLLVSIDGLIPVLMTLYTLMAFGEKSWYMIALSATTVLLSSVTGGYITFQVLRPFSDPWYVTGGNWPAICGSTGPAAICNGIGVNFEEAYFVGATQYYLIGLVILDTIALLLFLWKICTDSTQLWHQGFRWTAKRLGYSDLLAGDMSVEDRNITRNIRKIIRVVLHSLVVLSLLACFGIECYVFVSVFSSPFIDIKSWGFGQIVGLTTWAGVLLELIYLQYSVLNLLPNKFEID
jgi:hypothetical protein